MDILSYILGKKAGGGGGEAVLIDKNIDANGTYNASDDAADGYKKVVVDVPSSSIEPFSYILNRAATGDVVINVTNPPAENSTNITMYQGLLKDCAVSSIKMTGLWFIPRYFVQQENVGSSGSQSVLTSVESDARYCGQSAFAYAKALTSAKLYNLEVGYYNYQNISDSMFRYCTALQTIALPKLKRCDGYTLGNCTSLTSVDFGAMEDIRQNVFNGSSMLSNLIIRTSSLCALQNINTFTGTPFASNGTGGTLYVPQALIADYQAATNWSTILGYANNQILPIEGSIYATQYADGTPIS